MATTTITGMTAVTAANLDDTAVLAVDDKNGQSRKATIAQIRTAIAAAAIAFASTVSVVGDLAASANATVAGTLGVTGAASFDTSATVSKSDNSVLTLLSVRNASTGTGAAARARIGNSTSENALTVEVFGGSHATLANRARILNQITGGKLELGSSGAVDLTMLNGIVSIGTDTSDAASGDIAVKNGASIRQMNSLGTGRTTMIGSFNTADVRVAASGALYVGGPTVGTSVSAGDLVMGHATRIRAQNGGGTNADQVIGLSTVGVVIANDGLNVVSIGAPASVSGANTGDAVFATTKGIAIANAAGTGAAQVLTRDSSNRTLLDLNTSAFALRNPVITGAAGAVAAYWLVHDVTSGTSYEIPLHAVA